MKRISVALSILGLSSAALAAIPATTEPSLITVPLLPGGFFIGGSGFYLQPSQTASALDNISVPSGTTPSFTSSLLTIDPGYDWGWGVNAGYIFPNTGNDIQVSYFNFDNDDSNALAAPFTSTIGIFTLSTITSTLKVENDIDQVDLTAGQFIDIGCRLIVHPFTGLRWADIEQKRSRAENLIINLGELGTFNNFITENNKSEFDGIGPILGLDASYYIAYGFGAVGHFDSAVLIGNIENSDNAVTLIRVVGFPTVTQTNNFSANDTNRIVPALDAKLGLDYTFLFNAASNTDLTLEAGWQFTKYFNVLETIGGVITTVPLTRQTANFALQGPYATLVLHL